jgi:transposase-like protein
MPSTEQIPVVVETAQRLDAAAWGAGGQIAAEVAEQLGISVQTLHTWVRPYRQGVNRKRRDDYVDRTDADAHLALTRAEADLIAATMVEARRANDKATMTLKNAVKKLRRDGKIVAALSDKTISKALYRYGVHPEQITRARPHQPIRTLHPNHEWQVDASVCIVYYLPGDGTVVQEIDPAAHYKNKPWNLEGIASYRVIRYVLTDHTSGLIRWRYYPHSESGAHTVAFLAWAIAPKPDPFVDPFSGAPIQLKVDPGATASGTVRRFCDRLGIELIVTRRKNPRAKGQVEQANNLVELDFESGLRFQRQRVTDFRALNTLAERYQLHFNATAIHTRHGKTRLAAWMAITAEQLRVTEDEATLRALATEAPRTPTVAGDLTVAYKHGDIERWNVRDVPGVNVGDKLQVLWSPLLGEHGRGCAMAVTIDPETGRECYHALAPILVDANGFRADAPVSGEEHARMPQTHYEAAAKRLARLASGTDTDRDDELARRRKDYRPLADLDQGRGFNPYREAEEQPPQQHIPRRGTEHRSAQAPAIEPLTLDHIAAAQRLAQAVRAAGGDWGTERYDWLVKRYPDGVPADAIDTLVSELTDHADAHTHGQRPNLRAVR